ncbi:MAG: T9SS type A sorting domain-containing protein [Ignavibacteria bacterium]|nr:T9SS type A sorting domain-containing protein [Ignavibacteria bacterium]
MNLKTIYRILLVIITCSASLYSQATWVPMGSGLNNGTNGEVHAVTSYNGKIIVAGEFLMAGGISAQNIAAYDPVSYTWSVLGSGINGDVYALTVFNNELIAGGFFNEAGLNNVENIARWNGTSWQGLGSGIKDEVLALTVYSGNLIAGGNFSSAGGITANNIAKWNGNNWSALGSGLTGSSDKVNALTVYTGGLVAGGWFSHSGSTDINDIAKWNGSNWSSFTEDDFNGEINALTVFNGNLYVGGDFTQIGSNNKDYLAKWNGSSWSSVGSGLQDGEVTALTVYKNQLIVAGDFRKTGTGLFVDRIASWNGSQWSRLLTGHNDNTNAVFTYFGTDTILVSGGEYSSAGGKWIYNTAMWKNQPAITISGTVRYENNTPVTSGRVRLVRMDVVTREIIVVDSANVGTNGNFSLLKVPQRDSTLRVMIFPDDELNDNPADTGYVPTYYPSTIQWINAGVLYADNNLTNINIYVIRRNSVISDGSIASNVSGHVYLNISPPQGSYPFLKGSILYLKKDTSFVKAVQSNNAQQYNLGTLIPGTYTLTVQRLGYVSETRQLDIGTLNQDTVNFYLDTFNITGIVNINSNIPKDFKLYQNFPNPFNPSTKIRFALKRTAFTELAVFDILGKEVNILVNENLLPGEYEVSYNASVLPSGVYFYRLKAGNFIKTKKMVLIK